MAGVITGVTYNGVAMSLAGVALTLPSDAGGFVEILLFMLHAPASGANNFVVSSSNAGVTAGVRSISYTGVKQTSVPDSYNKTTANSVTSLSVSTTTVLPKCWTVGIWRDDVATLVAGTGTTLRAAANSFTMGDSNGVISTPGSTSLQMTWTGSGNAGAIIASFAGADDITLTVPVGAVVITGLAPSLLYRTAVAVPAGTMTFSGVAPGSVLGPWLTPGAGSITFAGASVRLQTIVAVPKGSIAFSGLAPSNQTIIAVGAGSMTFTGYAPVVTAPDLITVQVMLHGDVDWTDVSLDVKASNGLNLFYGMPDGRPTTILAQTGEFKFWLDNSAFNTAGLQGYYAPNNSNCLDGFQRNIKARVIFSKYGVSYYKFVGRLKIINPLGGKYGEQYTACTVVDYMDDLARANLSRIPTQINVRADEMLDTMLAEMPTQPTATDFDTGVNTFLYGMVGGFGGIINAMQESQRIVASEQGLLYVKGDTVTGGVLRFERYLRRVGDHNSHFQLNDDMMDVPAGPGLDAPDDIEDVINSVHGVVHPRAVVGSIGFEIVLYSSLTAESTAPMLLPAGNTVTVNGPFRDPSNPIGVGLAHVAGIDMLDPDPVTDYTANSQADGLGIDYTANIDIVTAYGSTGGEFIITNSGPDAYITKLQCRGVGLYDYDSAIVSAEDVDSQDEFGTNPLTIDMPYQGDPIVAQDAVDHILVNWKTPFAYAKIASFLCDTPAKLIGALSVEVGDRVTIVETVTGVSADFFVNGVKLNVREGPLFDCAWVLAPASYGLQIVRSPDVGALTFSGLAPTVRISGTRIEVPCGSIAFSGIAPDVGNGPVWLLGDTGHGELGDKTFLG